MTNRYTEKELETLFKSSARVKTLAYIFLRAGEPIYIRKISRTTECGINSISRELRNLEKLGLVFNKKKGPKRMYYINEDFPYLPELRGIIHKTLGLGGELLSLKQHLGKISLMVLTKTFLEGKVSSPEDLDLLVVGEPDFTMIEVCVKNTQEMIDKEINYMVMNEQDYALKARRKDPVIVNALDDEGLVIWRRD